MEKQCPPNKGTAPRVGDDLISRDLLTPKELVPLLERDEATWGLKMESLIDRWLDHLLGLIEEKLQG